MKIHSKVELELVGTTDLANVKLNWNQTIIGKAAELLESLKPAMIVAPENWDGDDLEELDGFIRNCLAPPTLKLVAHKIENNDSVLNPSKDKFFTLIEAKSELAEFMNKASDPTYELRSNTPAYCVITPQGHVCGATLYFSPSSTPYYWSASANDEVYQYSLNCKITFSRGD